jgi:excisionase family DNA binding protein
MTRAYTFKGRNAWTPEADELLVSLWGMFTASATASKMNAKLGTRFSDRALVSRAQKLGLNGQDCQGYVTIADAARELGVRMPRVWKYVQAKKIPTTGRGRWCFLNEAAMATLRAAFPPIPVPTVTVTQAAARLHFRELTIRRKVVRGELRGYRQGDRILVALADIERLERIQRGGGLIGDVTPPGGDRRAS